MATLVLTVVGTAIGGPLGGAIGAFVGRQVDSMIFGGGTRDGPRLTELNVTTSSYGMPVPRHFGTMRAPGQIIWATDLVEHRDKQGGGKGKPSVTTYSYSASFAVALSSRPIGGIGRIWADGKLLRGAAADLKVGGQMRIHTGAGDQPVDPLLAGAEGASRCPAYRGLAYVVFEDLQLDEYGNRIPSLSFEVIADNGPLSLAALLDGVVDDADADVALTGLTGLSCEGSLADLLSALDPLYPVDCDACDERLAIRPDRHQANPVVLPEAATSTRREDFGGNAGYARKRGAAAEAPVAVLRYYDTDRDFQPGAQRAPGRPLPGQPRTIELPGALNAGAARQLVERAAKRSDWARQTVSWRVTHLDPAVRPGANVTLPGHAGLWRVREWEWQEQGIDLMLTRLSPALDPTILTADPGRANLPPDQALATTALAACELPWDGNPSTPVPLLIAAPSSPSPAWSGASLFVDQGDGALLPLGPSGRARAVIGAATTALGTASPLLFDRHRMVTVQLVGTDLALSDATMRQLAMGANRALLGSEIIQFASADPLGGGLWALSGLWRGRGGTESAISTHAVGDRFVLLDGTAVTLDPEAVGGTPEALIAAIGLGDSAPVTSTIALRGIGHRPPSPVHGCAVFLASGGLRLSWTRRARGGWLWQDGVDTPLNEQSEAYDVTFGLPSAPLARWVVSTQFLVLSQIELAPLLAALPQGPFTIRQIGDRAWSEPLTVNLI
jgi:hypothetical protein